MQTHRLARGLMRRHVFGFITFLGLAGVAACSGDAEVTNGKDCDLLYESGCGTTCESSADCSEGMHCSQSTGTCDAECLGGGAECGAGYVCSGDGRCIKEPDIIVGLGGAGGDGGGTGGSGAGSNCIDVDVTFTPQTPTVMLLVDRSGSMVEDNQFEDAPAWDCDPDDNDWRWNVARYVLMHPTEGVVKPLEDKVRFGQVLYSAHENEDCPDLAGVVSPALNNHDEMLAEFECNDTYNDTPTKEALEATVADLAAFDEPGPKVIVLATDGEPDSCEYYDWDNSDFWDELGIENQAEADQIGDEIKQSVVDQATAAHELGITVHVIHIAEQNPDLWAHVQEVAEAGGGEAYDAYSVTELKDAFQNIVDGSRNCKIDLDGSIEEGKESSGTVTLDGEALELDDPNGWRVTNESQIELLGEACETIKAGEHDLDIKFPCGTFVPILK